MKTSFKNKVAILLFANSPEEDMRQKSLYHSTELFEDLTRRTKSTVTKTGLTFIHMDEEAQRGSDFGQRFSNAIRDVFDQGYEYVITVGNDSPQLKSSHILDTLDQLQDNKVVVGPSADGGFYLMGIPKAQFSDIEFENLPWQTSGLQRSFFAFMKKNDVDVHKLGLLNDIDSWRDLLKFASKFNNIPKSIFYYVHQLLKTSNPFVIRQFRELSPLFLSSHYNKGSPF